MVGVGGNCGEDPSTALSPLPPPLLPMIGFGHRFCLNDVRGTFYLRFNAARQGKDYLVTWHLLLERVYLSAQKARVGTYVCNYEVL